MKKKSIGILLSVKRLGDVDIIANFLTYDFGIMSGLIKAGQAQKLKSLFQIGSIFNIEWFARLSEHLGRIKANFLTGYYHLIMDDIIRIELFVSICNMLNITMINGDNSNIIYQDTIKMIKLLCDNNLPYKVILINYFLFEKSLLANLGFGFDLSKCAVNGETDISKLKYISPTTARAVSAIGGIGYEKKLFEMPKFFLINKIYTDITKDELISANYVLSYFIKKNIFINQFDEHILVNRNLIINKIIAIC